MWLCIHWVVQDTKQHPFVIHAGGVFTSVLFLLSFFLSTHYFPLFTWGVFFTYISRLIALYSTESTERCCHCPGFSSNPSL